MRGRHHLGELRRPVLGQSLQRVVPVGRVWTQARRGLRVQERHQLQVLRHRKVAVLLEHCRRRDASLQLVPLPAQIRRLRRLSRMDRQTLMTITAVGALAFAASWGIPTLMERAAQDEALRELSRLVRSASVYYVKPRIQPGTPERAACSFPQGEIRTTRALSCCDPSVTDGQGRCDVQKIEWNRSLWSTLRWRLNEPHQFVYEYKASGAMGAATLEVTAFGDQDCDGVYSTFRFTARGSDQAKSDDCILTDPPQFEAINPGE